MQTPNLAGGPVVLIALRSVVMELHLVESERLLAVLAVNAACLQDTIESTRGCQSR